MKAARAAGLALLGAALLPGCGGATRVAPPHRVLRVSSAFPAHQKVSTSFAMRIAVRAADGRPLGPLTVTLTGSGPRAEALSEVITPGSVPPGPNRALWVVESGPPGARRPDAHTWRVPGRGPAVALRFRVTPTRPGVNTMRYRVALASGAGVVAGALRTQITGAPLLHF